MGGIGVISNPRSRRNRRDPRLAQQLAYVLGEQGEHVAPGDLEALWRVAEGFRDREIDILAINGGDGTTHTALTAFYRVYGERPLPRLALLRGGTMNTVASGLGIKGRPDDLLGRLVRRYHDGAPLREIERTLMVVEGGEAGPQAGFLFGNGLISNFLEAYYEGSEPSPAKAAALLARAVGSAFVRGGFIARLMRRVRCRVRVDEQTWEERDWVSVSAGTVDSLGLRFRPFYEAPRHPGHLHAVGWATSPLALAAQLPRIRLALPHRHPDILHRVCKRMILEADEPLAFMVDGDFHRGGQRIEVSAGPRIRVVVPE
jgi:diacylglycerol kinase (ATP)